MRSLHLLASSALALLATATQDNNCSADLESLTITNLNDVRGNLNLATTTKSGMNVFWSSSNESVVSGDGIVKRQKTEYYHKSSVDCNHQLQWDPSKPTVLRYGLPGS